MSIFSVENLHKTYGDKTLFDHISFAISEKERIGLIGVNGTGKSTLLKVLARLESAESGKIIHANHFNIEYLPQQPNLDENLTVLDQIYYGESKVMVVMREYELALQQLEENPNDKRMQERLLIMQQKMDEINAWEANTVAKTILTRLGITNFSDQVKGLSGGQKKRIAIAKALIQPAALLLLDEPTNHLDHETVEWLEGYLSQYKGSLLLITHDRYFLNRVANRIFELDKGKLYEYDGNYETYVEKKAEREAVAETNERKRQNLLRRELEWLRRGAKARTTKQKARIQRVDVLANDKFEGDQGAFDIAIGSQRLGKKVIQLDHVSKTYGSTPLIQSFSYLVTPGERLGIIGANGSGKSTLLDIFAGQIKPDSGTIDVGETVKIGYYTQEYEEMDINLRVIEYIKEEAEVIPTVDGNLITAEQMLERFLFSRDAQWTYIRKLSGGERRRLYLLRTLMSQPNVLLLDEPTNDLDTKTLTILEDYLQHFPGVVITVSHDRYFLDKVVNHLLAFKGNGEIKKFQGNYSDYLESESTEIVQKTNKSTKPVANDPKGQQRVKLSYKDQREWETIEDKIEELEGEISLIKDKIIEAGSDSEKVQKFYEEQLIVEDQLEQTMERWEELSLLVEQIKDNK